MKAKRPAPAFYHIDDPADYFSRLRAFADDVLDQGQRALAPELDETDAYLERARSSPSEELTPRSPRGDLILAALGVEILNRDWQAAFRAAKIKVILTPHCMNLKRGKCQAQLDEDTGLFRCQNCSEDCLTGEISRLYAWRAEVQVYATKDRTQSGAAQDFARLYEVLQGRWDSVGVLGIACLIELWRGMMAALDAGVPSQGVPLLYPGCRRWSPDRFFLTRTVKEEIARKVG